MPSEELYEMKLVVYIKRLRHPYVGSATTLPDLAY